MDRGTAANQDVILKYPGGGCVRHGQPPVGPIAQTAGREDQALPADPGQTARSWT